AGPSGATVSAAPTGAATHASTEASPGAAACETAPDVARVRAGSTAKEPELYSTNEANAYGVVKDAPRMPDGSVHIPTVFHVVSDHTLSIAEKARWQRLITAQMTVLNN